MSEDSIVNRRSSRDKEIYHHSPEILIANRLPQKKELSELVYREIRTTFPKKTIPDLVSSFSNTRRLNQSYTFSTRKHILKETTFGIPHYAIIEVAVLIAALTGSLAVFTFTTLMNPKIAYVFLIPLFSSVIGIIFVFAKRT